MDGWRLCGNLNYSRASSTLVIDKEKKMKPYDGQLESFLKDTMQELFEVIEEIDKDEKHSFCLDFALSVFYSICLTVATNSESTPEDVEVLLIKTLMMKQYNNGVINRITGENTNAKH